MIEWVASFPGWAVAHPLAVAFWAIGVGALAELALRLSRKR